MDTYITATVKVGPDDLAASMSHEEAFEFIKALDSAMVDWDFTERCFEYFKSEMEKLPAEDAPVSRV